MIQSPYLWLSGDSSKPLLEMRITHKGRSETVNRALADFGIEESFSRASKRFFEHYHFTISTSTVDRTTKNVALQAEEYIKDKLQNADETNSGQSSIETLLAEMDGCEIRTIDHKPVEDKTQRTPVYNNLKKEKTGYPLDASYSYILCLPFTISRYREGVVDTACSISR